MFKRTLLGLAIIAGVLTLGTSAYAAHDGKTDGFVCPVISTENVLNSPKGGELGIEGYYTIGGPDVSVPTHATNGNGEGSPGGPFSTPGDTDYTAIWAG